MDLSTMKPRLGVEQDIKNFNGPGFSDMKVVAGLLLDIRDLLSALYEERLNAMQAKKTVVNNSEENKKSLT